MRKYEVMYIVNASLDDEKRQEVIDSMHAIITNGGNITKVDEWGVKEFAYSIDHMNKGYYMVVKFEANNEVVKEFDRLMRINQNIVRYMIIKEEQ